jgi:acyl-CoA synthetase (AMP-forming)/AMP-acid ligase II
MPLQYPCLVGAAPMNLATLLMRAGRVAPTRTAVALGDRSVATYGELAAASSAMGGALIRECRLNPADRVALMMRNCPEFVECLFGCWYAGLIAVPINQKLHPREAAFILENSGAKVVFVTEDTAAVISDALGVVSSSGPEVIDVGTADYRRLKARGGAGQAASMGLDATAWLFYTSGTTGRPKGAMLSHRNLLAMTTSYFADVDSIAVEDCILHAAPMSHGSGMYILPHVAAMATQVVPSSGRFDPAEILELISQNPGAALFAAPTMLRRLVAAAGAGAHSLDNLKTIICGGGPLYVEDYKAALACFGPKISQIYGQGESPMTITTLPKRIVADTAHPSHVRRLASVGYPHAVVDVRIADPAGNTCRDEEIGEVLVHGDTVMQGYWMDPAGTAEALRCGWLHTGDLAVMDCDGFVTLKGRSKELIISGGSNIYPREVEEILLLHPSVAEAAVVARPDPEWGETAIAFVVLVPGQKVDAAELDALCLENLARFKRPKSYRFVQTLPMSNQGKVLKTELRRMAEEGETAAGALER